MIDPTITASRVESHVEEWDCDNCGSPILVGDRVYLVDDRKTVERGGFLGTACSRHCATRLAMNAVRGQGAA